MGAHHPHGVVAAGVAQLSELVSNTLRPLQIGTSPMIDKLTPQREQQCVRPLQRQRELPRPRLYLGKRRRAPTSVGDQWLTEGNAQSSSDLTKASVT